MIGGEWKGKKRQKGNVTRGKRGEKRRIEKIREKRGKERRENSKRGGAERETK